MPYLLITFFVIKGSLESLDHRIGNLKPPPFAQGDRIAQQHDAPAPEARNSVAPIPFRVENQKINNFHELSRANGPEGHLRKSTLQTGRNAERQRRDERLAQRVPIRHAFFAGRIG
jgi:hypothetical protein